jgi:hypothetical protein
MYFDEGIVDLMFKSVYVLMREKTIPVCEV